MSGPMQWTANGLVPATGSLPTSGTQPGAVIERPEPLYPEIQRKFVESVAGKPTATLNVLALAKARLKEVKSELKKLKTLEKEKGELERLIAAAESKPQKSNLREIKRSAG